MAKVYAELIRKKLKTLEDVPEKLRAAVMAGVIVSMVTRKGVPLVGVGMEVKKGDVCGCTDSHSSGFSIWSCDGDFWRNLCSLPLVHTAESSG